MPDDRRSVEFNWLIQHGRLGVLLYEVDQRSQIVATAGEQDDIGSESFFPPTAHGDRGGFADPSTSSASYSTETF